MLCAWEDLETFTPNTWVWFSLRADVTGNLPFPLEFLRIV